MADIKKLADRFIPQPAYTEALYKDDGNTTDIATKVLQCIAANYRQLDSLAPHLKAATLYDTCRAIWQLVKHNIAYVRDPGPSPKYPMGIQWIKQPARLWADKVGDCKSYSVFIASCLHCLGIKGTIRFAEYPGQKLKGVPTHVYVVVKNRGKEIIVDAVMPNFDQEKAFIKKWDYNMTRIAELGGIPQKRATVNGGLSTLLNQGARRDVLKQALPGLAVLSLYVFIPGFGNTYAKEVRPLLSSADDLWSNLPNVVKQKTRTAADSFWNFGDWANIKVESEVFPQLKQILSQQLGMDPAQWWRSVLSKKPQSYVGFDPVTIAATVSTASKFLSGIKSTLGKLFGGSDIQWKYGPPEQWAPDTNDWSGYPVNPLLYLPVGSGNPQQPLPVSYIPPVNNTTQYTPAQQQPGSSEDTKDNTVMFLGIGVLALLLLKK